MRYIVLHAVFACKDTINERINNLLTEKACLLASRDRFILSECKYLLGAAIKIKQNEQRESRQTTKKQTVYFVLLPACCNFVA